MASCQMLLSQSGAGVLDLLLRLTREQGKTAIVITHDTNVAAPTPRTIGILDGRIESDSAPS
ncbi:MAG TPA: hypothetical protein VHB98_19740 [Chloroflexota bacterium]|nr:hypothetical protein [Chloroflexota bacterium]